MDCIAKLLLKTFHFALFGVEFKFVSFVIKFPTLNLTRICNFPIFFKSSTTIFMKCGINVHLLISWLCHCCYITQLLYRGIYAVDNVKWNFILTGLFIRWQFRCLCWSILISIWFSLDFVAKSQNFWIRSVYTKHSKSIHSVACY